MHIRLRGESLQQHDEDKYVWVVLVSSFTEIWQAARTGNSPTKLATFRKRQKDRQT